MLYEMYQWRDDLIEPVRSAASLSRGRGDLSGALGATLEMVSRFKLTHTRPELASTGCALAISTRACPSKLSSSGHSAGCYGS
jgi:hypothetical protein